MEQNTCCCENPSYEESGCCCGSSGKEIIIDYLYLDLKTCDRCIGTVAVLDEVLDTLRPTLELAGYQVLCQKREISNAELAEKYHFRSSPTILVNGQDIFGTVVESDCGCCGEIAGTQVDCRVFEHEGITREVPTKKMLTDAILKALAQLDSPKASELRRQLRESVSVVTNLGEFPLDDAMLCQHIQEFQNVFLIEAEAFKVNFGFFIAGGGLKSLISSLTSAIRSDTTPQVS